MIPFNELQTRLAQIMAASAARKTATCVRLQHAVARRNPALLGELNKLSNARSPGKKMRHTSASGV